MFKTVQVLAGLSSIILMLPACNRTGTNTPGGLVVFENEFRSASVAKTVDKMFSLYYLNGVSEKNQRLLKTTLEFELGLPIISIELEPMDSILEKEKSKSGDIHYKPTLRPLYQMRVVYAHENQLTSIYSLGKQDDGVWKIIIMTPDKPPDSQTTRSQNHIF